MGSLCIKSLPICFCFLFGLCSRVFICLVLLMDEFPSSIFIYKIFFHTQNLNQENLEFLSSTKYEITQAINSYVLRSFQQYMRSTLPFC